MYKFYPSRIPELGSDEYVNQNLTLVSYAKDGGLNRTASKFQNVLIKISFNAWAYIWDLQAGYQLAALALTLAMAIVSGIITGFVLKTPIMERIKEDEDLFDDSKFWEIPASSRDSLEISF